MKKIFFILSVFATSFSLLADNHADCFCGWDVTLGVGYSEMHENTTVTATTTLAGQTTSFVTGLDEGTGSVAVQGKVGLNMGFWGCWVLGAEVYAQYNNLETTRTASDTRGFVAPIESQITVPVNLGIDFRFGYAYCPNQLLFVAIGPDWLQHKQTLTAERITADFTKWIIAPRLVGGAEQRVCGKLILKEEFSFAWYQQFTTTHPGRVSVEHQPRLSTFMFSAGYLF